MVSCVEDDDGLGWKRWRSGMRNGSDKHYCDGKRKCDGARLPAFLVLFERLWKVVHAVYQQRKGLRNNVLALKTISHMEY